MRVRIRRSSVVALVVTMAAALVLVPTPALADTYDCSEAGLLNALDDGGGPHTFDCAAPTTVVTTGTLVVDASVILDGEGLLTVSGDGTHMVFEVGSGAALEVRNLAIIDGYTTQFGGGIYAHGASSLVVIDSQVTGNSADRAGGGIYVSSADAAVELNGAEVTGNVAAEGGGMYIDSVFGSFRMIDSFVHDNVAEDYYGGMYVGVPYGRVEIENGAVNTNTADDAGGMWIDAYDGNVSIRNLEVASNVADWYGGMYLNAGRAEVEIVGGVVHGNQAATGPGGGFYIDAGFGELLISGVAFTENHAERFGGGLYVQGARSVIIEDSEFTHNSAGETVGALWASGQSITVARTMILANSASAIGGAELAAEGVLIEDSAILANEGSFVSGLSLIAEEFADIRGSCIAGNEAPAVISELGLAVEAAGNWWGDASGPSGAGLSGSGDEIADPENWLVDPWSEVPLGPCVLAEAPWAPGSPPSGACEILVWFDSVEVLSDTDGAADEWRVTGAMRFYDFDETRDREVASIGLTSFSGDSGDSVVLEQQWRTEMWDSYVNKVRLDDVSIVVSERDGRAGDDRGSVAWSPGTLIECGEMMSLSMMVPVAPLGIRGRPSTTDSPGVVEVSMTVTAVPVTWMPGR